MIIGKALGIFRKNLLGLTQRELSDRIHISQSDVSTIERNGVVAPATYFKYEEYFERLGRRYGYSMEEFAKVMITGNPESDIHVYR